MSNKNYGISFFHILTYKFHQRGDLLGCEHCSGLIHDQNSGIQIQSLENFHLLLGSHRKITDILSCRHLKSILISQCLNLLFLCRKVDFSLTVSQNNVFCDRMSRNKGKMLLDHGYSVRHGFSGRRDFLLFAVDPYFTGGCMIQAVKNFHNRTFSGSVFSKECYNLPFMNGYGNIIVCKDFGKSLGDMF